MRACFDGPERAEVLRVVVVVGLKEAYSNYANYHGGGGEVNLTRESVCTGERRSADNTEELRVCIRDRGIFP